MRRQVTLPESSAAHRSFHYRPQDPVWSNSGLLADVRKRLSDFDSGVSVWWSNSRHIGDPETPGRWRVVQWCPGIGNWTTAFYWEGENGCYLEPNATGIINRLQKAMRPLDEADEAVEENNRKVDRKRRTELVAAKHEYATDLYERRFGVRQTFAPGYRRRREVSRADLVDTNHNRFVREHQQKYGNVQ